MALQDHWVQRSERPAATWTSSALPPQSSAKKSQTIGLEHLGIFAAEDASSHTEIVKSPPRTEPTRLNGACTRTVQSCTLRKDGATVHSNRILLRIAA